jgi:hypothetical protein
MRYLPRYKVSLNKITPTTTEMMIPKGLNIATKTGPVLCRHHAEMPTWNAEPNTAYTFTN